MAYEIKYADANLQLFLTAEIDLQITTELKQVVEGTILQPQPPKRFQLFAGQVSYIDSSGIALLLLIQKLCMQHYISFQFVEMSDAIFSVLKLAKLEGMLNAENIIPPAERPSHEG